MARQHPTDVLAAVDSLAQAGKNAGEIRRMLLAGSVPGLDAYDMPKRTIQHHAQRARRELEPLPADDVQAVNALEQRMLRLVTKEVRRLELKQRTGLSATDSAALRSHHQTINQIRATKKREPAPDPQHSEAGKKARREEAGAPATLLTRIGSEIAGRGPASPSPRSNAGNEDAATPSSEAGNGSAKSHPSSRVPAMDSSS